METVVPEKYCNNLLDYRVPCSKRIGLFSKILENNFSSEYSGRSYKEEEDLGQGRCQCFGTDGRGWTWWSLGTFTLSQRRRDAWKDNAPHMWKWEDARHILAECNETKN
jgi:hypothetical protein